MKSAVESLSPTRAKLTVEVPFSELEPSLKAAYQKIAKQINIPGFRRGKVPPPVIDRQVGRKVVLDEAVNDAIPKVYAEALREHSLDPVAHPAIEVTRFQDRDVLEFTAEVEVRPDIDLPEYEGVSARVPDREVTDEDVEEQVQALRERFGSLVDVDRPAEDGDFVVIDLVAHHEDQVVEGADLTGMSYQLGRGGMLEGLDETLVGMSAGDSREFGSQLVGGDLVGESVDVTVTVSQVQEQELPEVDDEFAQMASEFDTVEELTADLRQRLARGRRLEQAAAARDAVLEALLDRVEIPLPEGLVADELTARRESLERQLSQAGMTLGTYLEQEEQTVEEFEADLERRVRDAITAQFVLDEIIRREEFRVEQDELTRHLVMRAQQAGEDPQDFANHMIEHNHLPELVQELLRAKALAKVVESALVTDESGNPVELATLRPDGRLTEAGDDDAGDAAVDGALPDEGVSVEAVPVQTGPGEAVPVEAGPGEAVPVEAVPDEAAERG